MAKTKFNIWKRLQAIVSDPSASGNSLTFIKSISQDKNGAINPSKATVSTMTGASANADGEIGLVPKPLSADVAKFLKADGTWSSVPWSGISGKPSYYDAKAVKSITRSGTTFTATCLDDTTFTFDQQDTNTWRPVQNNLTSDSTTDCLSAAQGKALNEAKVAKAGDTMTGDLTFSGSGRSIKYTGTKSTGKLIKFLDNTSDAYGNGIVIGDGGLVIVGAGESGDAAASGKSAGTEDLYLTADGTVYIQSNCNTYSNAKTFTFSTGGVFTAPGGIYLGSQDMGKAVKSISRSGTTFTATCCDGTTFTFTQQDNNTWRPYTLKSYNYSYSVNGGSTVNITGANFKCETPSGYTAVAVQQWQSGNDSVVVAGIRCQYVGSDWVMKLRNLSSSTQTGKAYINILYLKD